MMNDRHRQVENARLEMKRHMRHKNRMQVELVAKAFINLMSGYRLAARNISNGIAKIEKLFR